MPWGAPPCGFPSGSARSRPREESSVQPESSAMRQAAAVESAWTWERPPLSASRSREPRPKATLAPSPLCSANMPEAAACCSAGNASAASARIGPCSALIAKSITQKATTARATATALGSAPAWLARRGASCRALPNTSIVAQMRAVEARMKGLRRPSREVHRSDHWPTTGCTTMPEIGPANQIRAVCDGLMPSSRKVGVAMLFCTPQAICAPQKPTVRAHIVRRLAVSSSLALGPPSRQPLSSTATPTPGPGPPDAPASSSLSRLSVLVPLL
mmetsp:Transcript_118635/g.369597  ORF Transcript_118635/g.369597 Transcript_118635/m.369597 type:complete len:273 (+) Transcript_118635:730-1548(+)